MPTRHKISLGECAFTLAARHGFATVGDVWDHADNKALRDSGREPGSLAPGDEITLPDRREKKLDLAVDRRHRLVVRTPKGFLRLRLIDVAGEPLAKTPYELRFGATVKRGTTDADGILEEEVAVGRGEITVSIAERVLVLKPGQLPPLDDKTRQADPAIAARLRNLGYAVKPPRAGTKEPCEGLRAFQADHDSDPTGAPMSETVATVKDAYGR